jgi:hypothetical protein
MRRKKKFDAIRTINRGLDRAIRAYGRSVAPRRRPKTKSFFDMFMDEATCAPKRRW